MTRLAESTMPASHPRFQRLVLFGFLAATAAMPASAADVAEVRFNRDVRPILADRCFSCHGPDEGRRKAGLRLDRRESAIARRKSRAPAIVPGKTDASPLVERIFSDNPAEAMPPPASRKVLTTAEKEVLRRWVAQGAEYEPHWAFLPPKRPPLPRVKEAAWLRNGVDNFILTRLEKEGLHPAPEAEKTTLIRRVTLDLTGLPPTPAEVDAFLADTAPDAYKRLVDRLLASPRYGEKMALHWLDAGRYADTHGYQTDQVRQMWPWREWVIEAFNRNQPFDQFTVEQIAGDLLPGATVRQKLATGFNRNHRISEEGGIIEEELRVEYVIDRVATTSTVWLGLTMACCQCHDHKYDPIPQKDYYRFFAYFNSVADRGNAGQAGNAAPTVPVALPGYEAERGTLLARVAEAEAKLHAALPAIDAAQAEWEKAVKITPVSWDVLDLLSVASRGGATLTKLPDKSVLAGGVRPNSDTYEFTARTDRRGIVAIRLEALADKSLPGGGPGRFDNSNFLLSEFELDAVSVADPRQVQKVKFASAYASYSQNGYEIARAIDGNPGTGWAVDGPTRRGVANTAVFVAQTPIGFLGGTELRFRLRQEYNGHQLGRVRLALSTDQQAATPPLNLDVATLLSVPPEKRTAAQKEQAAEYYRTQVSPVGKQLHAEIEVRRKAVSDLAARMPTAMVMQDLPAPRDTFVLIRGQYDRPGEKVSPGVPASLPPLPAGAPANRLGLARWLVDPANPLTARVAVNRYWQLHFGTGLVRTAVDFGIQGEWPSHPELLDWLADEFVRSGWDVKAMQRLLVTSAAYRQSSRVTLEVLDKDPDNRLLSRGPRFRLSAEEVRDQALAVSGLLVERLGGPSVKPYQPAGLWEELTFTGTTAGTYQQDHGEALYRRSLYTFWKRTIPPPSLATLDAPTREFCTVNRPRTNTPLQALVLLNDPTYVEASRVLAARLLADPAASPGQRLTIAFRRATARQPTAAELGVLLRGLQRRRAEFTTDPAAAARLLGVGEAPAAKGDAAELAAYTAMVGVILNLDEALTRE
jgi:hypothetical protein